VSLLMREEHQDDQNSGSQQPGLHRSASDAAQDCVGHQGCSQRWEAHLRSYLFTMLALLCMKNSIYSTLSAEQVRMDQ
jgi:hypothetical protein